MSIPKEAFEKKIQKPTLFKNTVAYFVKAGLNPTEAEECAQETQLRAWEKRDQLTFPDRFPYWYMAVARSVFLQYVTRIKPKTPISLDAATERGEATPDFSSALLDSSHNNPEHELLEKESLFQKDDDLKTIWLLVRKLSPQRRTCLVLRYRQGLDYISISKILRLDIGTVKSTLHQAHRQLKEIWEKHKNGQLI